MIDTSELTIEKLVSTSQDTYELLLFILNDLVKMICFNADPSKSVKNQHHFLIDDDFNSLDPILSQTIGFQTYTPGLQTAENAYKHSIEDFHRRMQVLDDANYLKEYRNILESRSESLIPPDMKRLITKINESSEYMSGVNFGSRVCAKEDVVATIEAHLQKLIGTVQEKQALLESVNSK